VTGCTPFAFVIGVCYDHFVDVPCRAWRERQKIIYSYHTMQGRSLATKRSIECDSVEEDFLGIVARDAGGGIQESEDLAVARKGEMGNDLGKEFGGEDGGWNRNGTGLAFMLWHADYKAGARPETRVNVRRKDAGISRSSSDLAFIGVGSSRFKQKWRSMLWLGQFP
jgi:hypothetical protein